MKYLIILFYFFMIPNFLYSETWICSYKIDNEARSMVVKRDQNNKMIDLVNNYTEREIIFENSETIHLYTYGTNNTAIISILDKKNKRFEMIAINPLSVHIEGDCIISEQ